MKLVFILLISLCLHNANAIGLADFVPNFLATSSESKAKAEELPAVPSNVVSANAANSSNKTTKSEYCRRNSITNKSIFCGDGSESNVPIVENQSIPNNGYSPPPSSNFSGIEPNQTALQSQSLRAAMGKYSGNYMLSVQPKDNLDIGMGVTEKGMNELQFNLKY